MCTNVIVFNVHGKFYSCKAILKSDSQWNLRFLVLVKFLLILFQNVLSIYKPFINFTMQNHSFASSSAFWELLTVIALGIDSYLSHQSVYFNKQRKGQNDECTSGNISRSHSGLTKILIFANALIEYIFSFSSTKLFVVCMTSILWLRRRSMWIKIDMRKS